MFNTHLTYRICRKDDINAFNQLNKLGETLISNPAEAHLYDDPETLTEVMTSKQDYILFGAFEENNDRMVAGMSMYNLFASHNDDNHKCAEEFKLTNDGDKDVLFTNFMAVSYLYANSDTAQQIIKYVYRWAKRNNVSHIVGTCPNRVRGKVAEMFSECEINFSAPDICQTSKGEPIVCMHFCVEVK